MEAISISFEAETSSRLFIQTKICLFYETDDVKNNGGKTLVHCHAGISRSAAVCLAYLMTCKGMHLDEAFKFVKEKREVIAPNFNFMGQLLALEKTLKSFSCEYSKNTSACGKGRLVVGGDKTDLLTCTIRDGSTSAAKRKTTLSIQLFCSQAEAVASANVTEIRDVLIQRQCLSAPATVTFSYFPRISCV